MLRAAASDPAVEIALAEAGPLAGRDVLEVGVGTGFGLPWLAGLARTVVALEPHPPLVQMASRRAAALDNVVVQQGVAQRLPVPDGAVDVVLARWAYFFGPGCEPGLREARRVLRRGGSIVVTDVDATAEGPGYARWFRLGFPDVDVRGVERFWARLGFARRRVVATWQFDTNRDVRAVLAMEFPPSAATVAVSEVGDGLTIRCPTVVRTWHG
jgi:SAM-dependent methyltransferase